MRLRYAERSKLRQLKLVEGLLQAIGRLLSETDEHCMVGFVLVQKLLDRADGHILLARCSLVSFEHDEITLRHWLGHVDAQVATVQLLLDPVSFHWGLWQLEKSRHINLKISEVHFVCFILVLAWNLVSLQ